MKCISNPQNHWESFTILPCLAFHCLYVLYVDVPVSLNYNMILMVSLLTGGSMS